MSEEKEQTQSKSKNFFSKIKKIKGLEIAVVVIIVAVMLLIAVSTFSKSGKEKQTDSNTQLQEYCTNLEKKLNTVLSKIEGAGSVSTMITFEGGYVQKLAYTNEESATMGSNGDSSSSNETNSQNVVYITENGKETPVVLCQENPKISGVVVVCKGAKNVNVKLDIIRAVSTLLNIDPNSIEVLVGK